MTRDPPAGSWQRGKARLVTALVRGALLVRRRLAPAALLKALFYPVAALHTLVRAAFLLLRAWRRQGWR